MGAQGTLHGPDMRCPSSSIALPSLALALPDPQRGLSVIPDTYITDTTAALAIGVPQDIDGSTVQQQQKYLAEAVARAECAQSVVP